MRTRSSTTTRAALAILAAGLLGACGGGDGPGTEPEPTPPQPGALVVALDTPNADDGAVLFTITGGTVTQVTAPAAYKVYSSGTGSSTTRVLVTGALADGALVTIQVPDVAKASSYVGSVTQAAARATYEQRTISAYKLTVARP
jgi:hypothetical protein